jgi:hypothetical protein
VVAETEPVDEGEIVIPIAEPEPEPEPALASPPPPPPPPPPPAAKPGVEDELAFLRSVTSAAPPAKTPPKAGRGGRPAPAADPDEDAVSAALEAVRVEPSPSRKSLEMEAPDLDEPPEELEAAAHMVDLPPAPADEPPQAARAQPEAAGEKGLVCAECGTTNRATEWYCAKCGAELSAV